MVRLLIVEAALVAVVLICIVFIRRQVKKAKRLEKVNRELETQRDLWVQNEVGRWERQRTSD